MDRPPFAALPADARAAYDDDGYVVVRGAVAPRLIAELQDATDVLVDAAKDLVADSLVGHVFYEVQSHSGRKREAAVFPGALRKITGPSKGSAAFQRLKNDRGLAEIAHVLGVAGARVVVDQVNLKEPRVGTGFPFHQDAAFLHGAAKDALAAHGGVNAVVALDAADADNGGFIVLGGTHKAGLVAGQHMRTGYDTSTMNEGVFDGTRRAIPALAPGDAIFFHPLLAHGSGPNRSERRRRIATLWYVGVG